MSSKNESVFVRDLSDLIVQIIFISEMEFSRCEPPGVHERRQSVNLEALISGENQTLGEHSGHPSE
jgi:hypothetical protein